MSATSRPRGGRRRSSLARLSERIDTSVDAATMTRTSAAAEHYGVAVSVVAREAINSGLDRALEKLRQVHRRESGADAVPEADG